MNNKVTQPVQLYGDNLEEVEEFIYLGSLLTCCSSEFEVRSRLTKSRPAFILLRNFWNNGNISTKNQTKNVQI